MPQSLRRITPLRSWLVVRRARHGRGSLRAARQQASDQLLQEPNQILFVEWPGPVGTRVEEAPHFLLLFPGVEDQLLFDDVFVEQFLIKRANGPFERVGDPKILSRYQFYRGLELNLQDAAADVHLN